MNFDPIHWACVGLGAALAVLGVAYWYQGTELEISEARYSALVADVKAQSAQSEAALQTSERAVSQIITNIQGALNEKTSELDRVYADYERLRRADGGTSRGPERALAAAAAGLDCPSGEARLTGALEQLEAGVLPILRSRDAALDRNQKSSDYIQQLHQQFSPEEN